MIYIVNLSKGDQIKIDEEDLQNITRNIKAPLIRVKQGIINPSFMISIIPTDEKDVKTQIKVVLQEDGKIIKKSREVKTLVDKMSIKNNLLKNG